MLNKTILIGRVGNIESKVTSSGMTLTKIAVATNEQYKDKQGQKVDETTWHNVHCLQKLGEIAVKYLQKGDLVYIEGKNSNKKITDGNGTQKNYSCIMAKELKILSSNKKDVSKSENYGNVKNDPLDDFLF